MLVSVQPNPDAVFPPGVAALASSWSAQSSPTVPGDVVVVAEIVAAQIVLRGSLARVAPLTAIVAVISIPLPLGEPPANPLSPFPAPKLAPPANNEAPPSPDNVDAGGESLQHTGSSSQAPGSCIPGMSYS